MLFTHFQWLQIHSTGRLLAHHADDVAGVVDQDGWLVVYSLVKC